MITVENAKKLLMENAKVLPSEVIKISDALNRVLAENIFSPLNLPPFNQSAMDGYAMANFSQQGYETIGEIKAGDKKNIKIGKGETIRIFTGAQVPDSAFCVVMQEKVSVKHNLVFIEQKDFKKNQNIRPAGSHIKKGELAFKKGTVLNPAAIGFLASLGIQKIIVHKKPVISIIITGNELKVAGDKIKDGEIYESNSFALNAALQKMNITAKKIFRMKDKKNILTKKIREAISIADIVIISGGISVGKYDFVKESMEENGVKNIFYKVAQKPGKPIFLGKSNNKIIFALPGNPAATLVCFYEYVYPAIKKMMGYEKCFLSAAKINLLNEVKKKSDRAYFLKGKISEKGVISLEGQESYMLKSFAEADALIYLPFEKSNLRKNEIVEVHFI